MSELEAKPVSTNNKLGLAKSDYLGGKSTLCVGCGHDSITNSIISSFHASNISPYDVAKMSGIGCSSKTPGYFLSKASGFNSIHGRMAPVSTGAKVANQKLITLGISGDGDTASIGLGGFVHLMRRNVPMAYLVANNGVYGLTKGQFSATSEKGSRSKAGGSNPFSMIDLCSLALDVGCTFVARSFSGDAKQLVPLISAAVKHNGTALIDIISPCVTYNNHEGSTKSYNFYKDHKVILQELGLILPEQEILADYDPGSTTRVDMPDGSILTLKKLALDHDVTNRWAAQQLVHESNSRGEILTGLLYIDEKSQNFLQTLDLTERPLSELGETETRPSAQVLSDIFKEYR
ncbi:MAG: 2-oxoacid:ferredoxin oxidoreductase subunit beta [Pseudomonadota bacterium]|nr:2-oxoacid:ferredoxin oxidoreductase subunit beta [Pseudomonadota bacterium]